MRLSDFEIATIKEIFHRVFGEGQVYLFGSRVDDSKRGGDIDLYLILSDAGKMDKKSVFILKLEDSLGPQKIDIVMAKDSNRPIEQEALRHGIRL
jgi:predicted nucleotidyltransferase